MSRISLDQKAIDPVSLREKLPQQPGVYLFKDASDRILYIGKAKDLRKRVLSYFKPPGDLPYKTARMLKQATGLDYFLTATENEAFILEDTLVKKNMPRYNVVLRDDKRFPCLRLDTGTPYPKLTIVRRIKKDGALYFGPFSSAGSVRRTLKLINRVFQLRKCKTRGLPKRSRPCLNFQLERCFGPCAGDIDAQTYGDVVKQVRMFLEGRNQELLMQTPRSVPLEFIPSMDLARKTVQDTLASGRDVMIDPQAKVVLAAYGIPTLPTRFAGDAQEAAYRATQIGFPVVLKLLAPDLPHRLPADGIALDLTTAGAVEQAAEQLIARLRAVADDARYDGFSVQKMVHLPDAHELLAIYRRPQGLRLQPTVVGQRRVVPPGNPLRGRVGRLAVAHEPEFESAFHGERGY